MTKIIGALLAATLLLPAVAWAAGKASCSLPCGASCPIPCSDCPFGK